MQTIEIDINNATDEQIDLIVDYLKRGQVIAYPTDTIYGLGCDAGNAVAVEKIKKIKGGREDKPFIALISDFKMLKEYCEVNAEQLEYLEKVWVNPPYPPLEGGRIRPVTVILESQGNLPHELTGGLESLAVRLPANDFLVKIISKCGFPVVSTSLNKTGQPPLSSVQNLEKHFKALPDLAVDAGAIAGGKPSKLIDLRDVKDIKVIRK
jgi:L-threonylcarbamoyladenylate synthase